jgi:hypothetical protein
MAAGQGVIYEASFEFSGVFVKVDILVRNGLGWDIYEVKSGTKVKDENLWDVAVQHYVLGQAGLSINQAYLTHIDNSYVRRGDIDVHRLFHSEKVTAESLVRQAQVPQIISSLKMVLRGSEPDTDIGPHCSSPYECDYKPYCWQHIPESSVFNLAGRGINKFDCYYQGLISYDQLPLEQLNDKQRQQVLATLNQQDSVNREAVNSFLEELWYPLCHLDFETFQSAVPLFDDIRPYQQVPFQYSIHLQHSKNAEVGHCDYLAYPGYDPRRELAEKLIADIPENACILTYNKSFEIGVMKNLAEFFSDLATDINIRISNIRDLMDPFRKRDIYRWQLEGSYSIKKVLPAMVPELTYTGLDIADGGAAMQAYHDMTATTDERQLSEIRQNLLNYCEMDTWAMVKILDKLKTLVETLS